MDENEEIKHKFEVSDKLRKQLKEYFQKYVEKQLDYSKKVEYDNILASQSFIEKQMHNSTIEIINNGNESMSNFNDKSLDHLFSQTYDKKNYMNAGSYS